MQLRRLRESVLLFPYPGSNDFYEVPDINVDSSVGATYYHFYAIEPSPGDTDVDMSKVDVARLLDFFQHGKIIPSEVHVQASDFLTRVLKMQQPVLVSDDGELLANGAKKFPGNRGVTVGIICDYPTGPTETTIPLQGLTFERICRQ